MRLMIDLITANETLDGYRVRAWTGVAVDEGIGLISIVEVTDSAGRAVCLFEEFLDASVRNLDPAWPPDDTEAARRLQSRALDRAHAAITAGQLDKLNGHRFEQGNRRDSP